MRYEAEKEAEAKRRKEHLLSYLDTNVVKKKALKAGNRLFKFAMSRVKEVAADAKQKFQESEFTKNAKAKWAETAERREKLANAVGAGGMRAEDALDLVDDDVGHMSDDDFY